MKIIILLFVAVIALGCATPQLNRDIEMANYRAYLDAATKPMPVMEIKAKPGEAIRIEAESITFYATGNGNNSNSVRAYTPPENPTTAAVREVASRAVDVGIGVLPWWLAGKELSDVLTTALKNSGHNTTISGSYNLDRHDSGSWRDFSGNVDLSNRSISNSFNPSDRHDINNSYNPDRHDTVVPVGP